MSTIGFAGLVVAAYALVTLWLSWLGMRRTRDVRSFAIGNRDMHPWLVGITLAASISSTATFVINPGFVYTHGLAAFLHFGVAASAGIITAMLVLTRGFLRVGAEHGALTIPDWIYHRYGHRGFSLFFAVVNLLSITFVVLILVGCSLVLGGLFGIDRQLALLLVVGFVFSYVLMGGTYAHAYTNSLQGALMVVVSLGLFVHGIKYFDQGFVTALRQVGPDYASVINPASNLYNSYFSVFGAGFIVTFALMLQPHILTKTLYLKSERDINQFILATAVVGSCFALMLFLGFFARLSGLEIADQDAVVTHYLLQEFGGEGLGRYVQVLILVALLAAGMSTLDGILVSLAAMVVNDIYQPLRGRAGGLWLSRVVLVVVGLVATWLAREPPALVGIFAQQGVYGLAAASTAPVLLGVLYRGPLTAGLVAPAAGVGLATHLVLNLGGWVANPAVSASIGILLALALAGLCLAVKVRSTIRNPGPIDNSTVVE